MSVEHRALGPGHERLETTRGSIDVEAPAPSIQRLRFEGYLEASLAPPLVALLKRARSGAERIAVFDDVTRVTGYDIELRVQLALYAFESMRTGGQMHVLVRGGGLVETAVSVFALALGERVRLYRDATRFERAYRAAVAERTAAPSAPSG
jgi:hypothetical protein